MAWKALSGTAILERVVGDDGQCTACEVVLNE